MQGSGVPGGGFAQTVESVVSLFQAGLQSRQFRQLLQDGSELRQFGESCVVFFQTRG